jgi:xanthine dehydrogenase FAD-binding subunit
VVGGFTGVGSKNPSKSAAIFEEYTDLMNTWSHYSIANSIEEALNALASAPGPAYPVAGGTDLLLEIQQGRKPPVHTLVDLTHIPELKCLEERDNKIFIGAAVPISKVVTSSLVKEHAQAVAEACNLIGGPQVRNTATLGGNVAHALPAADGMISLVAMDAQVEVASSAGCRLVPILNLFKGPGVSALDLKKEILVGFYLPARKPGQASSFSRVMRPQGVALPILNMAVNLERSHNEISGIHIAIGPSGPTPLRAQAVEQFLIGKAPTPEVFAEAMNVLRESIRFRTSARRATAEYRYQLAGVLLDEVIMKAWQRAEEVKVR